MRTAEAIDARKAAGSAAFIGYLPAGFPSVEHSIEAIETLAKAGADIIEIGLPYSDPTMDGPVIERAVNRALDGGFRVSEIFRIVEACAEAGAVPLIMSYYNPLFKYGIDNFARDFANAGGAGLITPDLIPEEAGEWIAASDEHKLDRIFLAAQSSPAERLKMIAQTCRGFVYAASTMGVTGTRAQIDSHARSLVERTRAAGAERVCIGIGVSTPEQAKEVGAYSDGVIVGSALVDTLFGDEWDANLYNLRVIAGGLAAAAHGEA